MEGGVGMRWSRKVLSNPNHSMISYGTCLDTVSADIDLWLLGPNMAF